MPIVSSGVGVGVGVGACKVALCGLLEQCQRAGLGGSDKGELWADQLSYYPGPDPGLGVGSPQNLYHLQMVGTHKKTSPVVPKL